MIARAAGALLALVICAWFVLGARQAHDLAGATAIVQSARLLSPAQGQRADVALDRAATLNPDRAVDVARAEVALKTGELHRAVAILTRVTREEPSNLQAWVALARAYPRDLRRFYAALLAARRVDPRLP